MRARQDLRVEMKVVWDSGAPRLSEKREAEGG